MGSRGKSSLSRSRKSPQRSIEDGTQTLCHAVQRNGQWKNMEIRLLKHLLRTTSSSQLPAQPITTCPQPVHAILHFLDSCRTGAKYLPISSISFEMGASACCSSRLLLPATLHCARKLRKRPKNKLVGGKHGQPMTTSTNCKPPPNLSLGQMQRAVLLCA